MDQDDSLIPGVRNEGEPAEVLVLGKQDTLFPRGKSDDLGIDALLESANRDATVIMCAEAVPWRCHRNLVADALTVRGTHVEHIMSGTKARHIRNTLVRFVSMTLFHSSSVNSVIALRTLMPALLMRICTPP